MENEKESLSSDQARILAHVEAIDADVGGTGPGEGPEAQPELQANAAEENKAILTALIALLTPALPFLPDCYPPDTIERIANAYTAVEEKHGWNVREMLSVEVQLAIVAIPPTISAVLIGRAYFQEKARRDREKVIDPESVEVKDGSHQ